MTRALVLVAAGAGVSEGIAARDDATSAGSVLARHQDEASAPVELVTIQPPGDGSSRAARWSKRPYGSTGHGRGIGLALARSLAYSQGVRLQVSSPGAGPTCPCSSCRLRSDRGSGLLDPAY